MTKKDYELIAGVFKFAIQTQWDMNSTPTEQDISTISALEITAKHMALKLQKENPSFNGDKFYEACGIK